MGRRLKHEKSQGWKKCRGKITTARRITKLEVIIQCVPPVQHHKIKKTKNKTILKHSINLENFYFCLIHLQFYIYIYKIRLTPYRSTDGRPMLLPKWMAPFMDTQVCLYTYIQTWTPWMTLFRISLILILNSIAFKMLSHADESVTLFYMLTFQTHHDNSQMIKEVLCRMLSATNFT